MLLIKNANIITMDDQNYSNGYIIVENSTIKALGNMTELSCSETEFSELFNADGAMALPGFIDAHCHIGLWEEGAGREGNDGNESTDPVSPQLRAIDSVNHADIAFKEALAGGVTTVVTGPGSANVIGGQFAALKTAGRWVDEMVIKEPIAIKAALGENPKSVYGSKGHMPSTRMASASVLRETLFKAKEYTRKWDDYNKGENKERPDLDFKLEALSEVMRGNLLLKVHIHRADDIATAIRIAEEFGIKITLEHCTEGHLILPLLQEKNLPVILGPTFGSRSKPELKNMSFAIYKEFEKAGIPFAIMTDHPEIPINQLYLCAALAHQSGIKKETALAAITINAAKHVGLENRIGSLAPGKDADIVIHRGELFSLDSNIEAVFLNGQQMK
ncbi:MAG: amidohydrolase [Ruminococcaceae bacterium]|nr:amidohydrolase [Oscillospiraceae bacterium]